MGYWPKHPKKELEAVLDVFHAHGWRIVLGSRYYRLRCPCGHHQRQLHMSPSGKHHGNHAIQWARQWPCWKEEP